MVSQEAYDVKPDRGGSDDEEIAAVNVDETTAADWSEDEERKIKVKLDLILLPILGLAFFALQMDRGNISNALTSTITTDLGVDTNQINVGTALLSLGIVLLEIPSNVLLQKIGPKHWLSGQIIAWGLVALFQNFITNYAGYLVTRILLGLCEAGFIPGALYTMSTWYKRDETSLRVSIFFLGNLLAVALTSLIGAGILTMGDRYGVAGWRWLFIVEGCITIGVGIIFFLFLPPRVGDGRPFISFGRWSYFDQRESYILVRRVLLDDPAKTTNHLHISAHDITTTLRKPRILMHMLITLTATIPVNAINTYGPSVIKSLGYTTVHANALASVGPFIAVVMVIVLGWLCDKTGRKGPFVLFAAVWSTIAFSCLREGTAEDWSTGMKYAAVVFSMATNSVVHIQNVGWLSANCQSPQERSVAMAMIIMAANAAGIAGSQVFRTEDAPLYLHAFTACLALTGLSIVEIVLQSLWYFFSNKKLAREDHRRKLC
ncbi:MFS general substrate transporter [Cryphonectria parasitica EP155]|uniref:MFS general substrate transporter n=1 Tax=Cryphonectria parasitica (strain ATCC 38755 / EP155) TaxID=660469 RepID=A0A9P5CN56_CRYP1|nr:MFS general substrate transporter [Cryphonectria parasitica EP155]KAF3763952.1 MFS general substrate transporter [Cryphonectria parasitica EP155]